MSRIKVMGIVNVTPDSFSDGGKFFTPEEAIRRVNNLVKEGADMIDIGGESTRPDAIAISWQEEWGRIEPVLKKIDMTKVFVSIDTYHPETAERALEVGARMINCVYQAPILDMLELVMRFDRELVMPSSCVERADDMTRIYLDPMIGFGTTREEDIALLHSLPELVKRGRVLVGVSRKRIIKRLTGEKVTGKNLSGNIALASWCALNGVSALRVHDVAETIQAIDVIEALS